LGIDVTKFDGSQECTIDLVRMLEALLVCAVQSEARSNYISEIQQLDTATQEQLMLSISQNMESYQKPEVEQEPEEDLGSPGMIDGDASQELEIKARRLERENEALKHEMEQMQHEISDIKGEKATLESESTKVAKHVTSSQLRAEVDEFNKVNEMRDTYESQLDQKQQQISELESKLSTVIGAVDEVTKLRDEVDLLQPMAKRAQKAEDQVGKYRAKLEQMELSRQQIKGLETQNKELLSEKLKLSTELEAVSVVKNQVEEYKQAVVDAEVRASELSRQLKSKDHQTEAMSNRVNAMRGQADEESDQVQDLLEQIRWLQQELEDEKSGGVNELGGIGCGMSDLNPEVVSKVAHLEHENKRLKGMLSGESRENLIALEAQVDDSKRLKESFETKYFDTRDALEASQEKLAKTEVALAETKDQSATRQSLIEELDGELAAETGEKEAAITRGDGLQSALEEMVHKYEAEELQHREDVKGLSADLAKVKHAAEEEQSAAQEALSLVKAAHAQEAQELAAKAEEEERVSEEERATERKAHEQMMSGAAADAEESVSKAREECERRCTAAEQQMKVKVGELEMEMAAFKKAHSVSDQEHAQERAKYEAQAKRQEEVIVRGTRKLTEVTTSNEMLEKKNGRLSRERNFMSQKLSSNQRMVGEQENDVSVDLQNLTREHKGLLAKYEQAKRRIKQYEETRNEFNQSVSALSSSVAGGAVGGAAGGGREQSVSNHDGSGYHHSLRQSEAQQDQLTKQKQELMLQNMEKTQKNQHLSSRVNKLEAENQKLVREKNSLQLKIMRGEKMLKQLQKSSTQQAPVKQQLSAKQQPAAKQPLPAQLTRQQSLEQMRAERAERKAGKENNNSNHAKTQSATASKQSATHAWPIQSKTTDALASSSSSGDEGFQSASKFFSDGPASSASMATERAIPTRRASSYVPSSSRQAAVGSGMREEGPGECQTQ
jgi:hypothetical protein